MNASNYIILLDPALKTSKAIASANIGDMIISQSMIRILTEIFPDKELIRFSPTADLTNKQRKLINNSSYSFIGGSNLLFSDLKGFRQLLIRNGKLLWLFPGIKNMILFGPGWGNGYDKEITWKTKLFYKKILSSEHVHAVRDTYSSEKLTTELKYNIVNTNCPSTWTLNGKKTNRQIKSGKVVFSLTDYSINSIADNSFIKILNEHFDKLIFFPQGSGDIEYLKSLEQYQKNKSRISLLPYDLNSFENLISTGDITYVGTRLHGGIRCLQGNIDSLIIAVDHRAIEMAKDSNLPVSTRNNLELIKNWLEGKEVFPPFISLPITNINHWRQQFH